MQPQTFSHRLDSTVRALDAKCSRCHQSFDPACLRLCRWSMLSSQSCFNSSSLFIEDIASDIIRNILVNNAKYTENAPWTNRFKSFVIGSVLLVSPVLDRLFFTAS